MPAYDKADIQRRMTGAVDALSLLALGRVFVADMTGNVVFIGVALGGAPGSRCGARCSPWSDSWWPRWSVDH